MYFAFPDVTRHQAQLESLNFKFFLIVVNLERHYLLAVQYDILCVSASHSESVQVIVFKDALMLIGGF